MRAVVIDQFGVLPTLREVPAPTCPADGVVLRVTATGVCRSDWHGWQGHDDDITLPHVPGPRARGVVVEVGPDVRSWAVGDEVTVPFVCACGACAACLRRRAAGLRAAAAARVHRRRLLRRAVALHHADVNLVAAAGRDVDRLPPRARLPVRDRLPRGHGPRPPPAGRLGRGARLRRRRALGRDDRRGRRRAGGRRRRLARRPLGRARHGRVRGPRRVRRRRRRRSTT